MLKNLTRETKEQVVYVTCNNGKTYDVFKSGDVFGFYSQRTSSSMAGIFRYFPTLQEAIDKIYSNNDGGDTYYFASISKK